MQGILAGLNDQVRRVREVAIKSSGNYHDFPEIMNRLKEIVTDQHEQRKIRGHQVSASEKFIKTLHSVCYDAGMTIKISGRSIG
jgi:hypothetical protein